MLVRCGDSQGFHFAVEVAALEPKGCGGLCHIPAVFLQLAKNKLAFVSAAGFVKGRIWMMRAFGKASKQFRWKVVRLDACLGADDDQRLHEVRKLTDISGPGIAEQNFDGSIAECAGLLP